jgi:hypothetical protein
VVLVVVPPEVLLLLLVVVVPVVVLVLVPPEVLVVPPGTWVSCWLAPSASGAPAGTAAMRAAPSSTWAGTTRPCPRATAGGAAGTKGSEKKVCTG